MGWVFIVGIMLAVFAVHARIGRSRDRRWQAILRELARRHSLTYSEDSVVGEVDGLRVTVDSYRSGDTAYARVAVDTDLPADLWITARTLFDDKKLAIGDDAFDARAFMSGDEAELVSRLGAETRAALLDALKASVRVEEGVLFHHKEWAYESPDEIEAVLGPLLGVARRLCDPRPLRTRLAAAAADPEPGVRARAIKLFAARFSGDPDTAALVWAALDDPSDIVRFAAVKLVPDDPRSHRALAAILSDADQEDRVRLAAARRLAALAPFDPALEAHRAWFVEALDGPVPGAIVAARVLGACAGVEAVEALLAHTRGVFRNERLRDAAQRAVLDIQIRASGSTGALSLTDSGPVGRLSATEAPDEDGA